MYTFIKQWCNQGTTIYPGVSLIKGDFIITDETVSLKGSEMFTNIPKEYLAPYTPTLPASKTRKKSG